MTVWTNELVRTSASNCQDARLARRQRIVLREEWCMQKNSRSTFESVSVRCKNVVLGSSQLQGRNYSSQ